MDPILVNTCEGVKIKKRKLGGKKTPKIKRRIGANMLSLLDVGTMHNSVCDSTESKEDIKSGTGMWLNVECG